LSAARPDGLSFIEAGRRGPRFGEWLPAIADWFGKYPVRKEK